MRTLEQETHPEVLRQYAIWLRNENLKMQTVIDSLHERINEKAQLKINLDDQLLVLRKQIYGRSSEKRAVASDRTRGTDEEQLLLHSRSLLPPVKETQTKKLEEDVAIYELTSEELRRESELRGVESPSSEQWEEIENLYDQSREVTVIERVYKTTLIKKKKYKLKAEYNTSDKEVMISAHGPDKLLPGSTYSIDFATSVVADKYISHVPFERQTREMESLGLKGISTKTLYNLSLATALHLEEVVERIKNEILSSNLCAHLDETPWPIQIKEQDDGYMWVLSNQAGSYYCFEPTRSGTVSKNLLENYTGPVMADGYVGYNRLKKLENIVLANCWAHARRKFIEIEINYPSECKEILDLTDELFKLERVAKDFDQLKILREIKSKPLIEQIHKWLIENLATARSESGLLNAIEYSLKYWIGLTQFLKDIRIPLTNNEAERTIRHAVVGRKNSYGSRTHNGADVSATLYSIIESCKKVGIDPRTYINMAVKLSAQKQNVPTPLQYARKIRAA